MTYKVIATRGVWYKAKCVLKSRLEFVEESNLEYTVFFKEKLREFRGWVVNVRSESNV